MPKIVWCTISGDRWSFDQVVLFVYEQVVYGFELFEGFDWG